MKDLRFTFSLYLDQLVVYLEHLYNTVLYVGLIVIKNLFCVRFGAILGLLVVIGQTVYRLRRCADVETPHSREVVSTPFPNAECLPFCVMQVQRC